jgi:hypothetical protein
VTDGRIVNSGRMDSQDRATTQMVADVDWSKVPGEWRDSEGDASSRNGGRWAVGGERTIAARAAGARLPFLFKVQVVRA